MTKGPGTAVASTGDLLRQALTCTCPRCGKAGIYAGRFSMAIRQECPECGLDFSRRDVGDGAIFFILFGLCIVLPPAMLAIEFTLSPPVWVHIVLWPVVAVALTVYLLRPLTSLLIGLQFWQRPETFRDKARGADKPPAAGAE